MKRFTLSFLDGSEPDYQSYYFSSSIQVFRIVLLVIIFIYSAFGLLDVVSEPGYSGLFLFLRFGIVVPFMVLVLVLSYSTFFKNIWQVLTFLIIFSGSLALVVMLLLIPGNFAHLAELVVMISAGYFFIRLRFYLASLAGWLIFMTFLTGVVGFTFMDYRLTLYYSLFFTFINLIGMIAAFQFERNNRRNFFLLRQLDRKRDELEQVNEFLEDEVRQRTNELAVSEAKYRRLVEEINEVIFLLNGRGAVEYISPVVEQLTGLEPLAYYHKPFANLAVTEHQQSVITFIQSFEETDTHEHEFRLNTIFEDDRWAKISLRPVFDNDKITGYRGLLHDITSHKISEIRLLEALEKAEASNRLKTAFLNNISHEIRTPLNGILGFGQLISQTDLKENDRKNYFDLLQKSTDRLLHTITNYMDVSMITSGTLLVKPTKFSINELLTNIHQQATLLGKEKGLTVNLELAEETEIRITSDSHLLDKAIWHIINNALKFTNTGSITIGLKTFENEIEIFISDTGIGIKVDVLQRIFEPFGQEEISFSRRYEGSGLGLTIAKGIVEHLHGNLRVESTKSKGSIFHLSLPLA